jgi:hypothetical protein
MTWIKVWNELLDDPAFNVLPEPTQIHLIKIWLLVSRIGNSFPNHSGWVADRIDASSPVRLDLLIAAGFLLKDAQPGKAVDMSKYERTDVRTDVCTDLAREKERKQESNMVLGVEIGSIQEFFQNREPDPALRNPRSLSIPKDPSVLAETVYGWLLGYWPEERIGAGMPMAIRTWQGTIPDFLNRAAALKRELETGEYGTDHESIRWRDLSFQDQRGKIALNLNSLKRVAESRGA